MNYGVSVGFHESAGPKPIANKSILMGMNHKQRLLTSITKRKMAFVGHVMRKGAAIMGKMQYKEEEEVMRKQNFETHLLMGASLWKERQRETESEILGQQSKKI